VPIEEIIVEKVENVAPQRGEPPALPNYLEKIKE
jgi:hypothetical protein